MSPTDNVIVTPVPPAELERIRAAGAPPAGSDSGKRNSAQVVGSLLGRARRGDEAAMKTMFQQFIPADEKIYMVEYLGTKGIFGIGQHSFGCLTERRVADITVGLFKDVLYQDGYLEHINSAVFHQPSLAGLYFWTAVALAAELYVALTAFTLNVLGVALFVLVAFLTMIVMAKGYYMIRKSGLVLAVREGINVYMFTNRARLMNASRIWRMCTHLRDQRMKATFTP